MSVSPALHSSERQDWATPDRLFRWLDSEFRFDLDAAAEPETARAPLFFTPDRDALNQEWRGSVWLNPPYGRELGQWIRKAYESAERGFATVVCLVPARTDTSWWHRYCMRAAEVRFLRGRLCFDDNRRKRAPFPSAIVVFRPKQHFDRELARCDREIAEMQKQPVGQPAYLTTLGILDWEREKSLIQRERKSVLLGGMK